MGRVRNISGDLHSATARGRVRPARVSQKDAADKPKGHRTGTSKTNHASARAKVKPAALEEPLVIEEFDSVWEALGFSPQESANLQVRADLMLEVRAVIRKSQWTQAQAAKKCGVSQPRINDLLRGKIDKFSVDALINMAATLGLSISVHLNAA